MGVPASGQSDLARVVAGTLTGTAPGPTQNAAFGGRFNLTVTGTWVGTIAVERSFDAGASWVNATLPSGAANLWTSNFSIVLNEPEQGVLYRLNPNLSSGAASFRLSGAN